MRTKNAKRLWPVPATLGVVALAALLALGLLATYGAQPVAAQDGGACTSVNHLGDADPDMNGDQDAFECQVTSSDAVITLTNGTDNEHTFYVFAEAIGSGAAEVYPPGTMFANGAFRSGGADTDPVVAPIRYQIVKVPAKAIRDGSATVTIPGSALDTTLVYVYAAEGFPTTTAIDNNDGEEVGRALPQTGTVSATVTVIYLGPPVRSAPDDYGLPANGTPDGDKEGEPRSNLTVSADSNSGSEVILPDNSDPIIVSANVVDRDNRPLRGSITYTVTYVEDSDLKSGQQSYTSRSMEYPGTDNAGMMHSVEGWNSSTKAVAVMVSAMFTGETGSIELPLVTVEVDTDEVEEVNIARTGAAETLKAATFNVDCLDDRQVSATDDDLSDDTFDLEEDDCAMDARFGVGQDIVVKAHLEDSLGSMVAGAITVKLDSKVEDELDNDGETGLVSNSVTDDAPIVFLYQVDKDAMLGDHEITVGTAVADVDDVVLTVAVAGPPDSYMIEGPDRIDLNGSGMFTVTAMDKAEGIPHFKDDASRDVEIFIQGLAQGNTRNLSNGVLTLDADTGMGTFIVFAPNGATQGQVLRFFIGDSTSADHTVAFGMNSMPMSAGIDDVMMTMGDDPMMVEAMFTDADGQDLIYEWMSSDEMVATVMADDMDMSTASITAVGVGTATITVTATDTEGGMGMQTFMVTVEAAHTDTSLQDIPDSSISVTNNANSSITVNWMGGDNADSFIVVAAELGSDPFTYESENVAGNAAKMATISGLNIGSNYMVIVIALQGTNSQYGVLLSVTAN